MDSTLFLLISAVVCGGIGFLGLGFIFLCQKWSGKISGQAFRGQILIFILISAAVGFVIATQSDSYVEAVSKQDLVNFSLWGDWLGAIGGIFVGNVFCAQLFAWRAKPQPQRKLTLG